MKKTLNPDKLCQHYLLEQCDCVGGVCGVYRTIPEPEMRGPMRKIKDQRFGDLLKTKKK